MSERTLPPNADRLKITVEDKPGQGGPGHTVSCLYEVTNMDASSNVMWQGEGQHKVTLLMQQGPLSAGKPANGLTEEALLAIVLDRLRQKAGREGHDGIDVALERCEDAQSALRGPSTY